MGSREIDYVIALAECKSISKAAEILYISQPSLSRYLSTLEERLGVSLFIRTMEGTELTEAGQVYLEYAREAKRLNETMLSRMREFKRAGTSHIRIGMVLGAASLAAFNVADEMRKRHQNCEVEIYNILSKEIESSLREGRFDFAIGPNVIQSQEFAYELINQDYLVLVVPEKYDLAQYAEPRGEGELPLVKLRELPPMDYILQDQSTFVRKNLDRILQKERLRITPKMVVTGSMLALQAAERQMGCCIVALGHLPYLNSMEHLQFYQVRSTYSTAGVIADRDKEFTQEERDCISLIGRAIKEGEKDIVRRLIEAGKLRK